MRIFVYAHSPRSWPIEPCFVEKEANTQSIVHFTILDNSQENGNRGENQVMS